MTEEKLDEITQQFGGAKESFQGMLEDEEDELEEEDSAERFGRSARPSPREELERRLADARARRRSPADLEEPLA
jgi:Sec-independent protein translocase protein TatA